MRVLPEQRRCVLQREMRREFSYVLLGHFPPPNQCPQRGCGRAPSPPARPSRRCAPGRVRRSSLRPEDSANGGAVYHQGGTNGKKLLEQTTPPLDHPRLLSRLRWHLLLLPVQRLDQDLFLDSIRNRVHVDRKCCCHIPAKCCCHRPGSVRKSRLYVRSGLTAKHASISNGSAAQHDGLGVSSLPDARRQAAARADLHVGQRRSAWRISRFRRSGEVGRRSGTQTRNSDSKCSTFTGFAM